MAAHLAQPSGEGPWPAVLIGHDGIGLDGYQRSRADDLVEHGYVTLAMDYHGGQTFFGNPEAMLAPDMPRLASLMRAASPTSSRDEGAGDVLTLANRQTELRRCRLRPRACRQRR